MTTKYYALYDESGHTYIYCGIKVEDWGKAIVKFRELQEAASPDLRLFVECAYE